MEYTHQLQSRSMFLQIVADTIQYLISLLVTTTYLAKLTTSLGFSDSLTATITSCVALGFTFQLLAMPLFKKGKVKGKVTILYTLSTTLFILLYAVPFIDINPQIRTFIFVIFFLMGNFILNAVFPAKTNMYMSFVPDRQRGRFTAAKEGVSLVCGIAFQFVMGRVIDHYEAAGDINTAFLVIAATLIALAFLHFFSLVFSPEKELPKKEHTSLSKDIKEMLSTKSTVCIILLGGLWSVCSNIAIPFYGTYQVKELGFSMSFIAVLSIITAVSRIPASILLGKYADKHSFAKMLIICYIFKGISFLAMVFATPANGYILFPVYTMCSAIAFGGINSAEVNIVYDYVEPEKRMNVIAVKQTLYGLSGFLITIAMTPLVNYIQKSGNMIFGLNIYAQQVLSAISFVMLLLLILYVNKVILKIKPRNEN